MTSSKSYTLSLSQFVLIDDTKIRIFPNFFQDKEEDRKKSLEFHLKSQDYFGTLATILDLMDQERKIMDKSHEEILESIKKNLILLQKNYKIIKKKN